MNKKTIDLAAQDLISKAELEEIEVVWDRYQEQQPQCGFGSLGLCCRHCVQGPCRIDPFGAGPQKGVCGADDNLIVARNLLRQVSAGASAHVHHAYDLIEALELAAEGKAPYEIKDPIKLKTVAAKLGLDLKDDQGHEKAAKELALEIVKVAREDFSNHTEKPLKWLMGTAPAERISVWQDLGVLPTNADKEIRQALHQTTMGMDGDPVNLILSTVKLGLVDGYSGLHLGTDLSDILFGTPSPVVSKANLGVLKEDHVNIIVHGHVPLLSEKILEWSQKLTEDAKAIGAKGIQVAGICCTGNELLMRQGVPMATNYLSQELALITGAVDAMVVDVQCIMPSLTEIAKCYHTKVITTMPIVKLPEAEHVAFDYKEADVKAKEIVAKALEAFKERNPAKVAIPQSTATMLAGFSVEAILGALAKVNEQEPLKPLVDNIVAGNILGAVATVGCNNVKVRQDSNHVTMVKELIKNNVLVVTTGCSAQALGKAGLLDPEATLKFAGEGLKTVLTAVGQAVGLDSPLPPALHMGSCVDNSRIGDLLTALAGYLKVNIKDLPVAASAPEYQHEKALAIGTWALSLGVFTHLGVIPPVVGGGKVVEILTSDPVEKLLGGKFYVETDPLKAAQVIIEHLKEKRKGLGI